MIATVAAVLLLALAVALLREALMRRGPFAPLVSPLTAPVTPAPQAAPAVPPAASTATAARPAATGGGPVVAALRKHRWLRRGLSLLSVGLLAGAIGVLGYPFYTNLYQDRVQERLDDQLASPELKQAYQQGTVDEGDGLTRIKIPKIGLDMVVVEGTTASALRAGAGHYPDTPLPCDPGNVGIAGHRTTYGRPFHDLDEMAVGDEIILETPVGSCTYRVSRDPFIVPPTEMGVVAPTEVPTLTLTTCHPKGSARQRLIVQATLVGPPAQA